jgi:hypothetical protein
MIYNELAPTMEDHSGMGDDGVGISPPFQRNRIRDRPPAIVASIFAPPAVASKVSLLLGLLESVQEMFPLEHGGTLHRGRRLGFRYNEETRTKLAAALGKGQVQSLSLTGTTRYPPADIKLRVHFDNESTNMPLRITLSVRCHRDFGHAEAANQIASFVQRWFVPLQAIVAQVSSIESDARHMTNYSTYMAARRLPRLDYVSDVRRYIIGAYWCHALGRDLCQRLGGQDAVLREAPVAIALPLDEGVWLRLSRESNPGAEALDRLADYLSPLLNYSERDVGVRVLIRYPDTLPERAVSLAFSRLMQEAAATPDAISEKHGDTREDRVRVHSLRDLAERGEYPRVIETAERLYRDTRDIGYLYARAHAYFVGREFAAAAADFELYEALTDITGDRFGSAGELVICYWHLNQPGKAATAIRRGGNWARRFKYSPMLLYLAQRADDSSLLVGALQVLEQRVARMIRKGRAHWGDPCASFLLGHIDRQSLEYRLGYGARNVASFCVAVRALREGDSETFAERMTLCASELATDGTWDFRYLGLLARWEVERGFPERPFA